MHFRGESLALRNGVSLRVYSECRGDDRCATLLLPGLGCDAAMIWGPTTRRLLAMKGLHRCPWIAINTRGTWGTCGQLKNFDDLVQDVILLIDRLSLVRVVLVGHSLGGAVAVAVAESLPRVIDSLVLLNSVPRYTPKTRDGFLWRAATVTSAGSVAAILPTVTPRSFAPGTDDAIVANFSNMLAKNSSANYARLCEIAASMDVRSQFLNLKCRTHMATGSFDNSTGIGVVEPYARLLRVPVDILPAGHNLPLEAPALVAQLLTEAI